MAINIINTVSPLPNVITSKPRFAAAETQRLQTAVNGISDISARLVEIKSLKEQFATAAESYANGSVSLLHAVAIIGSGGSDRDARIEAERSLRRACKAAIIEHVKSVSDLLDQAALHRIEELAGKCRDLETRERKEQSELGIHADSFSPSQLLASLRETHARAVKELAELRKYGFDRYKLTQLAATLGIEAQAARSVDEAEDLDGDN
jgi:hypothetical protein